MIACSVCKALDGGGGWGGGGGYRLALVLVESGLSGVANVLS